MKKFLLFLFLFIIPASAQAVGVSVSPASLDLFYPSTKNQYINIQNISDEPVVVYIYADDYKNNFFISPQELELFPDEVSRVKINFDFKSNKTGLKSTDISILTKALDKKSFNAFSGLKIPTTVYITKQKFYWTKEAVFIAVFFGLLIIFGLYKLIILLFSKKKKRKKLWSTNLLKYHKKWYKFW